MMEQPLIDKETADCGLRPYPPYACYAPYAPHQRATFLTNSFTSSAVR